MAAKKLTKEERAKCTTTTPMFRVSYPHLFKAHAIKPKDEPKFSITMLFPKKSDLSIIQKVIRNAKNVYFGSKENWPDDLESPVVDGDDPKFADKEGYKGHWVIKATTKADSKPGLVDRNAEPIIDQADFYPGCYAIANINAFAWEYGGKEGISFALNHVQKVKDGKPIGGRAPVESVFAPIEGDDDDTDANDDEDDFKPKKKKAKRPVEDDEDESFF